MSQWLARRRVAMMAAISKSRPWLVASIGPLITMGLLTLVLAQPGMRPRWSGDASNPRLASLAAAVGDTRYVEARLTGGFRYGPVRETTRGTGHSAKENLALLAAAGQLQQLALINPTPDVLHAWGVAQLLLGDAPAAAATLETAVRLEPDNAGLRSDQAAAYIARATQADEPDDWPRALEAAERALATGRATPEASFNKALALDGMNLREQAIDAWRRVLSGAPESAWVEESRHRLDTLQKEQVQAEGSASFEWLFRHAPEACSEATAYAASARIFADASGDRFFVRVATAGHACTRQWVDAWQALERVDALIDEEQMPEARGANRALDSAALADESFQAARDYVRARLAYRERDYTSQAAATDRALPITHKAGYTVLRARLLRLVAYERYLAGHTSESRQAFEGAAALFEQARQPVDRARTLVQLAELAEAGGEAAAASRLLAEAMAAARHWDDPVLRAQAYTSAAGAHLERGNFAAAAAVLEAQREMAGAALSDLDRTGLHTAIGEALIGAGDLARAQAELDHAADALARLEGDRRYSSLEARVGSRAAMLRLARGDAAGALAVIDKVIRENGSDRVENGLTYSLIRVRALAAAGRAADAAAQLSDLLVTVRARHDVEALGQSQFHRLLQAAGEDVEDRMITAGDHLGALHLLQQVRREQLGWRTRSTKGEALPTVPPDTAIIVVAAVHGRLRIWTMTEGRVEYDESPLQTFHAVMARVQFGLDRQQLPAMAEGLSSLGQILFGHRRSAVMNRDRIIVVPDASTMSMPIGAALLARGPARRGQTVVVSLLVPNVMESHTRRATDSVLAIGNERYGYGPLSALPAVPAELREIAAGYRRADVRLAPDLDVPALAAVVGEPDVIHVAAHAIVEAGPRGEARLILGEGPGRTLTTESIRAWPLRGQVVVLSACASAAAASGSRDPMSLASAFVMAGARSVVGTLWDIPDTAARTLFPRVHEGMRRGLSPAAAVRAAQEWARHGGDPVIVTAALGMTVIE